MRASFQKLTLVSLAALAIGLVLLAQNGLGRSSWRGGSKVFELEDMTANSVELPLTNYGPHGQNIAGSAGTYWPRGTGMPYIFGAGIWVGALRGNDTLVSVGYNPVDGNFEFYPGPAAHNADHEADAQSHPEDRIYWSTDPTDLAEWPLKDTLGENIIISHQDAYCEYNDGKQFEGDTMDITIMQHAFAWNTPLLKDMVFICYTIRNNSATDTIRQVYVGADADDDVGFADDDLLGLDIGRSLGYTYTTGQEPGWDAPPPYFVGVRFLQGPKASDTVYVGDPADPDTVINPGEHLVLTAFKKCTRNIEPGTDYARYLFLAGYDFTTTPPTYNPFDTLDTEPGDKRKILAAGPFDLAPGAQDTLLISIMFSNGTTGGLPYLLSQGDAAKTLYDMNWVIPMPPVYPNVRLLPGDERMTVSWDNYAETVSDDYRAVMEAGGDTLYAEFDVEGYYVLRSGTGRPEDWDTLAQFDKKNGITLLPDGTENGVDEGLSYVYVDTTVYNGFTYYYAVVAYDYNTTGEGPNVPNYVCLARAPQTELTATPRSETASEVTPATADVNKTAGAVETLDSLLVTAQAPYAVLGHTYELRWGEIKEGSGLPVYTYEVVDTDTPITILSDVRVGVEEGFTLRGWSDSTLSVDTLAGDTLVITTFHVDTFSLLWEGDIVSPLFDGLELTGIASVHNRDRVVNDTVVTTIDSAGDTVSVEIAYSESVVTTLFTADSLVITTDAGTPYGGSLSVLGLSTDKEWAFHGGSTYEMRWMYYNNSPETLTVEVWDLDNSCQVPFDSELGDNWCFGPQSPAPPLAYSEYITQDNGLSRSMLYICGVKYWLNDQGYPMPWASRPDPGDIWTAYNSGEYVPCSGNVFEIPSTAVQILSDGEEELLDAIRVVPNPYVVRNDWEVSRDYARIQFTHLPAECTIRIYTIAGNLIKTIRHEVSESELSEQGGTVNWDVLTNNDQIPASGIYIYHVSSRLGEKMGKFAIIK